MSTKNRVHAETYAALSDRIKRAKTQSELETLEIRIFRHYNAGTITTRQAARLDDMVVRRLVRFDLA